uniref:Uncharacterized protein n=1 Tax=Molossus molossus TaxID=27622 RepID=A0A7J8HIH1_MOLMO|nr:hypothetical protein HJG59_011066 [Molossus molossus]
MLKPNAQCDGMRRCSGHECGALMNEWLLYQSSHRAPGPARHVETQSKDSHLWTRKQALTKPQICRRLNVQTPEQYKVHSENPPGNVLVDLAPGTSPPPDQLQLRRSDNSGILYPCRPASSSRALERRTPLAWPSRDLRAVCVLMSNNFTFISVIRQISPLILTFLT